MNEQASADNQGRILRVLMVGDVFGKPGRSLLMEHLGRFRDERAIDFCVINAENAAGGSGVTPKIADGLLNRGADLITAGDHVWDRMELEEYLSTQERIIRPLNFPVDSPGRGMITLETSGFGNLTVINLLGRVFMRPADNPFAAVENALKRVPEGCKVILVEIHAEATSEKIAMGRFLDGRVSAVIGTHTHVATADAVVLPGGTAYMTDIGMTGPFESIIGLRFKEVLLNYRFQQKRKFVPATEDVRMQGVIIEIDGATGKALGIEPVEERFNG